VAQPVEAVQERRHVGLEAREKDLPVEAERRDLPPEVGVERLLAGQRVPGDDPAGIGETLDHRRHGPTKSAGS